MAGNTNAVLFINFLQLVTTIWRVCEFEANTRVT